MNTFERTLLIDADDTLWDNNIHFENAIKEFVEMMKEMGFPAPFIEEALREREMVNVEHHGYGSVNFGISMREVYEMACKKFDSMPQDKVYKEIKKISLKTRDYPITILKGVMETLPLIKEKNSLILVTKGNDEEQLAKVARSGLEKFFKFLRVVPEKNEDIYKGIIDEFKLDPETTWMVGNSPRSDINPAKAIGLGTVFVPYHNTWEHELEDIADNGKETIHLDDFSGLIEYFG